MATKQAVSVLGPIKTKLKDFQVRASQKAKGLPDDKLQQVFRELQPRPGLQELISEFKEVWAARDSPSPSPPSRVYHALGNQGVAVRSGFLIIPIRGNQARYTFHR